MRFLSGDANVFPHYDLEAEVTRRTARAVCRDDNLQKLADCLVSGEEEGIKSGGRWRA